MNDKDVAARVLALIAEVAEDVDFSDLDPDVPFREQLGLDSVDFLDFVVLLRKRHGIVVLEDDFAELMTLNSCVAYLGPKFEEPGDPA